MSFPAHSQIARKAYQIWQETGRDDALANWFDALSFLVNQRGVTATEPLTKDDPDGLIGRVVNRSTSTPDDISDIRVKFDCHAHKPYGSAPSSPPSLAPSVAPNCSAESSTDKTDKTEKPEEARRHTLSFTILNDLRPCYGPVHLSLSDLEAMTILEGVKTLAKPFLGVQQTDFLDPSGYFFKSSGGFPATYNPHSITQTLKRENYCVWNRYEKYYVYAWAIDGARFEVFSKDCDKQLIDWGTEINGEIVSRIMNPQYNENPVVSLLSKLYS